MVEQYLHTPRGRVCYWRSDDMLPERETLVLLHGLTADHTLFARQTEFFEPDYNLIVWDAPAHGSSRPYIDFSYPNAAMDLRQLLDENGVASAVMIGQSMGGFIIQSFIRRYPERVKAFIGIDTCPYGETYYSFSDKWWLRQVEWMSGLYPLGLLKKAVARQCTRTEHARQNMLAALSPYGRRELCHLMGLGLAGFLEDNCELYISCPVLILCGEHDVTGKTKSYCRQWAEATGFPLVWIKDAAHNSNVDNPRQVNAEIQAFLERAL